MSLLKHIHESMSKCVYTLSKCIINVYAHSRDKRCYTIKILYLLAEFMRV